MSDTNLEQLKSQIISSLSGLSSEMTENDDIGYEAFMVLAQATGRPEFLQKAFNKITQIEDSSAKTNALIELLGEVELQMSTPGQNTGQDSLTDGSQV